MKLGKTLVLLVMVNLVLSFPVSAETPCEILSEINKPYEKGER